MAGSHGGISFLRSHCGDFVKVPGRRRPIKAKLPLALADRVSNRTLKLGEASCVTEMALMMACWKANEFSDSVCAKEITTFFECAAKAEAKKKETTPEESSGTLNSQQVNKLLGRFPNITHYY
ncbi:coiled-coil-helix-coiled-coil-helix domain-containing protein 1 [Thamnophis elegans]|uniref:coiled-coil-helix-coiled-coil-helix domain-containing protein 1 n=1 Tax=Thamnophis elegans TaxID=35005 RepID=UPI00137755B0|nr:coiled-coil-helix-coiled-coil-helix domain-containing protein 1 [Thamnophis elegans]